VNLGNMNNLAVNRQVGWAAHIRVPRVVTGWPQSRRVLIMSRRGWNFCNVSKRHNPVCNVSKTSQRHRVQNVD